MLNNGVQGQWLTNKRHKRSGVVGAEGRKGHNVVGSWKLNMKSELRLEKRHVMKGECLVTDSKGYY